MIWSENEKERIKYKSITILFWEFKSKSKVNEMNTRLGGFDGAERSFCRWLELCVIEEREEKEEIGEWGFEDNIFMSFLNNTNFNNKILGLITVNIREIDLI